MNGRANHRAGQAGRAARAAVAPEPAFALLTDGTAIQIRGLCPGDESAVRDLYRGMSDENLYLRFFGVGQGLADEPARRVCRESGRECAALGAWLGDDLVGVAQ